MCASLLNGSLSDSLSGVQLGLISSIPSYTRDADQGRRQRGFEGVRSNPPFGLFYTPLNCAF